MVLQSLRFRNPARARLPRCCCHRRPLPLPHSLQRRPQRHTLWGWGPRGRGFASSSDEPPRGGAAARWQRYTDPASGNDYYYNVATKATQWERPPELGEPQPDEGPRDFTARKVPSSPLERVMGFAGLGLNLAAGVGMEVARRATGGGDGGSALLTPRNSDVLAAELCRMRGAALKLGQMLSLQDESFLPPPLAEALKRVRTHADVMPTSQLERVMAENFGDGWREKFAHFGEQPAAAASIGQVHQAALHDGRAVAVKVQYPGVGRSIGSDLSNLEALLSVLRVAPPGLYLDTIIDVAREELAEECDYTREAAQQRAFRELLADDPAFVVPAVVEELSTGAVLTSDWVSGVPIDDASVLALPQERRDAIASALLRLCLREVFEFRLVQTDPNWSNFLYDHERQKFVLLDFGATRPLSKEFSDEYLRLVWAAANADREALLDASHALGFLTGAESATMVDAHVEAGFIAGEPFRTARPFDFAAEAGGPGGMTERMAAPAKVFATERLTPPPREIYALHRKLSGAISTCTKLGVRIECRGVLQEMWEASELA